MTCNMLRGHSGRLLLGRHLLSTNGGATASAKSSSHYHQCPFAIHSNGSAWKRLQRLSIAPTMNVAAAILCRRSSNSTSAPFACSRGQLGSWESFNSTSSSLAVHERGGLSRRYASTDSGGGNGSGIGNQSRGGGGSGGSGGSGGGSSSGAGDEGRWRIWVWYLGLLDTHPILTKAVTSAVLTLFGDIFCQYYLEKAGSLDRKRIAVMTFLGFGLVGPTLHFWYFTLSKLVKYGGPIGVGIRLVLDQFVFSPTFIATFMSCLMTLEGNRTQISAKLKQDWWSAVVVNWQIWIPAQIINFWLVPLKLQVAFANFIALFWNAYLSWKSHLQVAAPQSVTSEATTS